MTPPVSRTCGEFGAGGASPLVALVSSSSLLLPHSSRYQGNPRAFSFQTFFHAHNKHKSTRLNSKLGMVSCGLPWLIYPHFAQCLMVYLRRGEGGPPSSSPSPSHSIMGPPFHWPLPSHVTLLFLYKNHRPISCFHTHR